MWMHDQRLRRQVQSANEHGASRCWPPSPYPYACSSHRTSGALTRSYAEPNIAVELAPPTPTQRPRPISSSRVSLPNSTASTSASSRPPRKRPCRTSRTEPIVSRTSNTNTTSGIQGSNSMPSRVPGSSSSGSGSAGEIKLDQLLQRFELLSTPLSLSSSSTSARGSRPSTVLRDRGHSNNNVHNIDSPAPLTRSALKTNSDKEKDKHKHHQLAQPSPRNYSRGSATGSGSGSGTGAGQGEVIDSPLAAAARQRARPKPFKTPFLNPAPSSSNGAIRSSPRNHAHAHAQSPLRAAALPATHAPSLLRPGPETDTPCRGKIRKHNANVDIGEDDPEGDASFDSFDGIFQEGGPDVAQLLKTVDGY